MIGTESECPKSKKRKTILGGQSKILVSSILLLFVRKLKLNIHVHVPLKFIHLTYEYIHTWGILCISEEFLTVQIKGLFNTFGTA